MAPDVSAQTALQEMKIQAPAAKWLHSLRTRQRGISSASAQVSQSAHAKTHPINTVDARNSADGRNPFRTTWKPELKRVETIVCWYFESFRWVS